MEAERTAAGWVARRVVNPTGIETLRDHLYGWLGAPDPYRREHDPHASVFGIRLPASRASGFEREFEAFADAVGRWSGRTNGYHLYPSARNPMVVALDAALPADRVAAPVGDLLVEHGGRVGRGPTPTHVTLFKGGVRGEELQWAQLDESTRDRLAAVLDPGCERFDPPEPLVDPSVGVELGPPELEWN